jgi:hypothetical protein
MEKIDINDCEIQAIENYRKQCTYIDKESLNHFVIAQQTLFLLLKTARMRNMQVFDPKEVVKETKVNAEYQSRLQKVFGKVKSRFNDPETAKMLREVKIRLFPALFAFTDLDTAKSYVSVIHSLMVTNQANVYSFFYHPCFRAITSCC